MTVTSKKADFQAQGSIADSRDFEATFLKNWQRIYNVLFQVVGDRAEAEDLALETFWQLYQNPPSKRENLNGWLYRVALNRGFNALRTRKRRSHYEDQAAKMAFEADSPVNPADEADHMEQRRSVRAVLAQMKSRSAQMLVLRYSGFSYAEIAAAVKVRPSSVGTLLARAEAEFEKIYRQSQGE